jgi:hypothetical protein
MFISVHMFAQSYNKEMTWKESYLWNGNIKFDLKEPSWAEFADDGNQWQVL